MSTSSQSVSPLTVPLRVARLPHAAELTLPMYQTPGAAGLDLSAATADGAPTVIAPGARELIPTGFAVAIPEGYEGHVRPRSGLAYREGVTVLNAPGTIDSDYRGELQVLLINHGDTPFTIERGMRIAQLVITPVARAVVTEVETLDGTDRGAGGFGSTGTV